MQLGTFTADIIIDGKVLKQYDVVSESPTKMTCWIASEEGKSFSVKWECHEESRATTIQGELWVDGIGCSRGIMVPASLSRSIVFSELIRDTTTQELMFARVQLSDDDALLNKEIPKKLGEISLTINRGRIVKGYGFANKKDFSALDDNKFHERSKKATVHCIGFGPEIARIPDQFSWRLIPSNDPELTFVFKYQPLSVLRANGIAPRPTSNGANTGCEIDPDECDVGIVDDPVSEDIKPAQLNDRIKSLENKLKRLRDLQHSNTENQRSKRVKKEERSPPPFTPGEIIDLT